MTSVTTYTFNPLEDPRWPELVERHPRASFSHTTGWIEALRRTYGYEPIVYTTCPPSADLTNGIVFCRISSWLTGRRLVSLPFADHCDPLVDTPHERDEILSALKRVRESERLTYAEIRPLRSDLADVPGLERSRTFCFHVLDLRPSLPDLLRRTHESGIRRKIRRAEREGLSYEEGSSDALLDKFYRLLVLTRRRHGVPPQPMVWFRNLAACMRDRLKIRLAFKDGRPVASILTLLHRDTLVYKYGCSDAGFHNLGAMPALFWKAIQDAKEAGAEQLDLGRSDVANEGLMTFKEHLGASRSVLCYARCSAPNRRAGDSEPEMEATKRLVGLMPDFVLTAAGRLLYRHIG